MDGNPWRRKLPLSLAICGLKELASTVARFRPDHVISITDPDWDERPEFSASSVLRLSFFDVDSLAMVAQMLSARDRADHYPSISHAKAIIDYGSDIPPDGRLLIHCHGGVSRSTAAAFLIVAMNMPGDERGALTLISNLRPQLCPNKLIVGYGDKILNANGRMIAALGLL